ncbi:conserved hypothetical protein [Ahrensia sp. R2A130]|nr:conserved hypothetical protein [Ahrensia sp. R2A130]
MAVVGFSRMSIAKAFFAALGCLLMLSSSYAQEARVFGDGPITVRLCPATCQAVNGHGYKSGAPAQVLETRDGWARVSSFLPRRQLVSAFGWRAVPRKPALWVALSSLKTAPAPTAAAPTAAPREKKAEAKKPRRVDVVTRLARLRNPSIPSFRPDTEVAVVAVEPPATPEAVAVETPSEPEKPQEIAVAEPVEPIPPAAVVEPAPIVEEVPEAPQVVETPAIVEPVAPAAVSTTGEALTWEQLQERLAAQKSEAAKSANASEAANAQKELEAAKAEAARVAQEQEARQAAEAARQAEAAKAAREAEARKIAEAKARSDELAAKQAREKAEADELARQKAEADEVARVKAEADEAARQKAEADVLAKAEQQKIAEQKRREAEAEAAKIAAKQAAPKTAGSVGYTPPQPDAAPAESEVAAIAEPVVTLPEAKVESKAETTQVAAVKLPPVAPTPAPAAAPEAPVSVEKPQFSGPEPTYATAEPDPMDFGSRPKSLTKKLLDKRLSKLPGRKSKMPKEVVIALRHYALGLLNNGECTGVARGGLSASPGMIFISCSDDPTYLRQFPLQEQSW